MTTSWVRPIINLISDKFIEQIIGEAKDLLYKVGVQVESDEAIEILHGGGAKIEGKRAYISNDIIEKCCNTVPSTIIMYDRAGNEAAALEANNIYFAPGSAALNILDSDGKTVRKPITEDLIKFIKLEANLDNFAFQATSLISSDVPTQIQDRYRLFLGLLYSDKPVVTGTFLEDAFDVMRKMLLVIRGSHEELKEKPLAIFDCCPSSPLKWSALTVHDLIASARTGIPAELISMPLSGAAAPVTLAGTLVQHTAEDLSGIVIHQLTKPGAPIIYGGSPSIMDMVKGTTPMGAIETMMIDAAYARIGNYLGFPTHAYMGLSDSKTLDYQAGLETGMGALMAALGGVNVISGVGMLDFESCQSLEKLVYDNEIAGMAQRLAKGIALTKTPFAEEFFDETFDGNFLAANRTLELFQKEFYFPSPIIDRTTQQEWQSKGCRSSSELAEERVKQLLKSEPILPEFNIQKELQKIMNYQAKNVGMEKLPFNVS